jgi:acyl carrier protein
MTPKEKILEDIIQVLGDMTSDWDIDYSGKIGSDTHIISDLELESIDVVQFIVQLETKFQHKDLPFEKLLMAEGRYREDFSVQEVLSFLEKYL